MAALSDNSPSPDTLGKIPPKLKRRRYARAHWPLPRVSLTPPKLMLLNFLAECRFLSLPQLARLCCPSTRRDLSERSARRHMRELFDAGLVDVLPVSRAALAPPDAPNDASLLYGSAPNVFAPTRAGLELLVRAGAIAGDIPRPSPGYGPKNGLFLAHELAVRDVRVWLEECARTGGENHRVLRWEDGPAAAISLAAGRRVLPDAWFVYQVKAGEPPTVLVGLVEVDRGTERGDQRWSEKLGAYAALFNDRELLRSATGYINGRVLVIAPTARRRDQLAGLISDAGDGLASRFWISDQQDLEEASLFLSHWRQRAGWPLRSLIPSDDMST